MVRLPFIVFSSKNVYRIVMVRAILGEISAKEKRPHSVWQPTNNSCFSRFKAISAAGAASC